MRHPLTFAVTTVLIASAPALAQQAGTVQEISVVGTTDLLSEFLKTTLTVQPGAPLSGVNLRQVEQDVLASGYFKTATAELRTVSGRDTLVITVTSNPTIKEVQASGLTFLPADAFKQSIAELLNIAPGAVLNTQRIEQAKEALAQNYRQEGFPFVPSISTETKLGADGTATVSFVVDESAPLSRVEITGATLLPEATVQNIFRPLQTSKRFTTQAFFAASDALQAAYEEAGYFQAGIDPRSVSLENGVLKLSMIESRVANVDLSPLGTLAQTPALQTQAGQPLRLAQLQADVRALANLTGKPVGFALDPNPQNPAQVTVVFGAADVESGPVASIAFVGNTKVPTEQLQAAIKTKPGDVYSPQLAQDDFMALRNVYRQAGFEISTRDAISFQNGVLTYTLREVRLAGYELAWQGEHRTKDRVILRELPAAGQTFNSRDVQSALSRISALGYVTINDVRVKSDPQNPENVTYVIALSEGRSGIPVNLGLGYDSLQGGWSGDVAYTNSNAFGLGHSFGVRLGAVQNQAGQNWVGSLNYTIPWLDLDFADFRTTRTSLSFGVGSEVGGNIALVDADKADTGRDFTTRTNGFSLGLGRNITPNLTASANVSFNSRTNYLEPKQEGETSTVDDAAATALLPASSLTTRLSSGLNYDNTDNANFPGRGVRAYGSVGYNVGRAGDTPLSWVDGEIGVSGYYGFGGQVRRSFGLETYRQVLAARANTGATSGTFPDGTGYFIGGSNPLPSRELRGLEDGQLFGTNYFSSSLEYRYDFGLSGGVAQGLYGVVFADYGGVWNKGEAFRSAYGVGAGVQLNLGFGGAQLPSLRFDYGYSTQNAQKPNGRFHFRIGNFW
ncbi:BamA/OMP85 family outer membrane protein [Deinococcus wulumuqiensis]|uniref:Outer membrane protein n=1 Tax=Deinococcus wulumuqiensis TaxID=980427 RepID=A0AAV4K5S5_9DEIO|nr:outer membrane protein assembly factor [Deinococcus wulumuqiensis]QII21007.1 outer membrane protein assembly factor [Deinococcus wulumuqiensis R12]GGI79898.1 outer membrane protein [Deinococcus wulumuqiensis]GGP29018.1 outer membrane protein [Deinococcus wulumuqiensis]